MTPLDECFNGQSLFPQDPSWGDVNILDVLWNKETLRRRMYSTSTTRSGSSNCPNDAVSDDFMIPLNECVGPFGEPRPWGTFTVVNNTYVTES